MTEEYTEQDPGYEIVENPYTGIFIEEEFILSSGETIGYAEADWLLEMGVPADVVSAAEERQRWRPVRKERDRLLAETDWTQNQDVPAATAELWQPYRQALRDITEQSDPNNITWPTKPA